MRRPSGHTKAAGTQVALMLVIMSAFQLSGVLSVPVDCTDGSTPLFLRTSTSQMNVRAAEAVFCPIMPGTDEQDCSTFMSYRLLRLDEMSNPLVNWYCMDTPDIPPDVAQFFTPLRTFRKNAFQCEGDIVDQILAPGVSARVITTTFTHPSFPDMFLQLNYSVSNASIDFNYGTSDFMDGRDYIVSYRYVGMSIMHSPALS